MSSTSAIYPRNIGSFVISPCLCFIGIDFWISLADFKRWGNNYDPDIFKNFHEEKIYQNNSTWMFSRIPRNNYCSSILNIVDSSGRSSSQPYNDRTNSWSSPIINFTNFQHTEFDNIENNFR